jgi:hypothetical protein
VLVPLEHFGAVLLRFPKIKIALEIGCESGAAGTSSETLHPKQ